MTQILTGHLTLLAPALIDTAPHDKGCPYSLLRNPTAKREYVLTLTKPRGNHASAK